MVWHTLCTTRIGLTLTLCHPDPIGPNQTQSTIGVVPFVSYAVYLDLFLELVVSSTDNWQIFTQLDFSPCCLRCCKRRE